MKRVQRVRHDTAGSDAFLGLSGEITQNTDTCELRSHDGTTVGGHAVLTKSQNDILYQAKSTDLNAIIASSFGMLVHVAANTWAVRTIAGTTGEVSITNGDGVSGAPVVSLPTSMTLAGKTVTGGTFTGQTFSDMDIGKFITNAINANSVFTWNASGVPTKVSYSGTSGAYMIVQAGSDGKIDISYMPAALLGSVRYQSTWDASTNTPAIPAAASENKGYYYIVSVAGNTPIDGISDWQTNDWIVSDGVKWEKVNNNDPTASHTVQGIVRLGTQAEVNSGTDDSTAVTPLAMKANLEQQPHTVQQAWGYNFATITYAASMTWDVKTTPNAVITLTGNGNLTASNIEDGKVYVLRLIEDGTGGYTPVWDTAIFKFGDDGAPSLNTAASKKNYLTFIGYSTTELHFVGIKTGY